MGIVSRSRGQAAENQIDFLHSIYLANEQAFVRHNGVNAEMRGDDWVPLESLPDYEGCLTEYGARHVAFDLKSRTAFRYSHPKDKLHQSDYLWRMHQAKAVSFILLWIDCPEFQGGFALLPKPYWQSYYGKGWSLNAKQLQDRSLAYPLARWNRVTEYIPDWIKFARIAPDLY
jgi:hypothetical protein